jgi:hypothetical protein
MVHEIAFAPVLADGKSFEILKEIQDTQHKLLANFYILFSGQFYLETNSFCLLKNYCVGLTG